MRHCDHKTNEAFPDVVLSPESQQQSPSNSDETAAKRKDKGFRNPLSRTRSTSKDDRPSSGIDSPQRATGLPHTASLPPDGLRVKPKEAQSRSSEKVSGLVGAEALASSLPKEKSQSMFVSGSKNVMSKARSGGGNLLTRLGKLGRSGSSHEKEVADGDYVVKVITLPLVEQTRLTRISKDLASCRDKTEYWMPSLPWRCIE